MKTQALGTSDLVVTRLSYGAMRIAGTWNPADVTEAHRERGKAALRAAYEAGYTLFDHADIYSQGACESIHGELLREEPNLRERTIIATKCGIRFDPPHRYDFSREWILSSCRASLERLGVETIDVYQLHRPDMLMDPAEIADAFAQLKAEGKVRWFGVSNFFPSQVAALRSRWPELIVNQVEIHLGRLACLVDGTLDQCLELAITPLAWSPLGGGWLGAGRDLNYHDPRNLVLAELDRLAAAKGVSRTVIALAWLLKHPSRIIPIVGSTRPEAIREAVEADALELSREEWYRLTVTARGQGLP